MDVETYPIEGVRLIKPRVFGDHRGFFIETYSRRRYRDAGITCDFVQDNHSESIRGTVRGLHYQVNRVQAKLVSCIAGEVFDVAVDIRPDSPTYGKWVGAILSAENHHQLFLPEGFAHGFQVLGDSAQLVYKCSDFYSPADERGILWDDPELAIDWPGSAPPVLSDKDKANPPFRQLKLD